MTRQDAQRLIEGFAQTEGGEAGLNAKGLGGLATRDGQLYFDFDEKGQGLWCGALIYRFRADPRPGLLDALQAEAAAGTETAGGKLTFEPPSRGLFLARTYVAIPETTVFDRDLRRLMKAGTAWSNDVLPRVSERLKPPST